MNAGAQRPERGCIIPDIFVNFLIFVHDPHSRPQTSSQPPVGFLRTLRVSFVSFVSRSCPPSLVAALLRCDLRGPLHPSPTPHAFLRALCVSAVDFSLFPSRFTPYAFTPFSAPSAPLRWIFRFFPSRLTPHALRLSPRPLRLCGGPFAFSPSRLFAFSLFPFTPHPSRRFFQPDRADLVLGNLCLRIERGDSQVVYSRLEIMHRNEHRSRLRGLTHQGLRGKRSTPGGHLHQLPVLQPETCRIPRIYFHETLRSTRVQGLRTPGHGTRVIMIENPPGCEQERIFPIRGFCRRDMLDCMEFSLAARELLPVQDFRPRMVFGRAGPLRARPYPTAQRSCPHKTA